MGRTAVTEVQAPRATGRRCRPSTASAAQETVALVVPVGAAVTVALDLLAGMGVLFAYSRPRTASLKLLERSSQERQAAAAALAALAALVGTAGREALEGRPHLHTVAMMPAMAIQALRALLAIVVSPVRAERKAWLL